MRQEAEVKEHVVEALKEACDADKDIKKIPRLADKDVIEWMLHKVHAKERNKIPRS